jgi:hypothetical protein
MRRMFALYIPPDPSHFRRKGHSHFTTPHLLEMGF